jgi:hypothetical protein
MYGDKALMTAEEIIAGPTGELARRIRLVGRLAGLKAQIEKKKRTAMPIGYGLNAANSWGHCARCGAEGHPNDDLRASDAICRGRGGDGDGHSDDEDEEE